MAIYHFSAKVIQRSKGRSAVAAAAYRSASELEDEHLNRSHDFTAKAGVVHSEIMLPEGAPDRWLDRSVLWNEVEAIERRHDAVLAREVEFAIPRELSQSAGITLAQDFVREQFVARGMVADLNVHWTTAGDGGAQPHAHVMLSMRAIDGDGFGKKERGWNDRGLLRGWRERWAEMANARLCELDHDVWIDHRSYAVQGIDLEPQNKIGPAGARREHRGEDAERAAEHQAIARRNGEALLAEPDAALRMLTRQRSTFSKQDLARLVDRHTDGAEQFAAVMAKVTASREMAWVGLDGRGQARYSTREMLACERRMEWAAATIADGDAHRVLPAAGRQALAAAAGHGLVLGVEQRDALQHVTSGRDLALVVGYAGTGKSSMLGVARLAWEAAGYRVRGAALSGIAAEGLEAGSGIGSRTLASLEYGWKEGRDLLTARDVLVIDEAGLVGSGQMERVLRAASAAGAKVVLVGDPEQLQAIEAGAAFRALADRHGAVEITEVRRQREAWQCEATRELATGRTGEALGRYERAGGVQGAATREAACTALLDDWDAGRRAAPGQSRVILAATRAEVAELNRLARERLRAGGELGAEHQVATERGERAFAAGDRLMFGRNERALGAGPDGRGGVAVKNGTLGTVEGIEAGGRFVVRLDGVGADGSVRRVTFSVWDYEAVDHGYAATVHKAQGVTVDRAHVLASRFMDRHAAYVALTRHRDGVSLHYGRDEFRDGAALARALGRERLKDTSLDYDGPEAAAYGATVYAERRGLDPLRPESAIQVQDAREAEQQREILAGRAGFRERYGAHRQRQATERAERQARALVGEWDRLTRAFDAALPGLEADPAAVRNARKPLLEFGRALGGQPEAAGVLRERGAAFGVGERPSLARVLSARQPEQAVARIMDSAETDMRAHLRAAAEQEAARQRKLEAERQRQAPRQGPSQGMSM